MPNAECLSWTLHDESWEITVTETGETVGAGPLPINWNAVRQEIRAYYARVDVAAVDETPAHDHVGPNDAAHRAARDVADHLLGDRITPPARKMIRDALDKADAPPTGRKAADAGLGRAVRR